MVEKTAPQLRNAPEKKGIPIRKSAPDFDAFVKEWKVRLKRKGEDWEGKQAVAELQATDNYEFLLHGDSHRFDWLFGQIIEELEVYLKESEDGLVKEHYKSAYKTLRRVSTVIQKEEKSNKVVRLQSLFRRLREYVEKEIPDVDYNNGLRKAGSTSFQQLWPEVPRPTFVERRMDLDSRLQMELGKLFASFLGDISMATIARLILLTYRVGGLAAKKDGKTHIITTNKIVTVRTIRDKIEAARLHKAQFFGKRRRQKQSQNQCRRRKQVLVT